MNIRVYESNSIYKDVDNVNDDVREIRRLFVGGRIIDVVGPGPGDVAFRRTEEIESGRVVFRKRSQ